jgi:hypothetical protein
VLRRASRCCERVRSLEKESMEFLVEFVLNIPEGTPES